jgi:hypothetical protein
VNVLRHDMRKAMDSNDSHFWGIEKNRKVCRRSRDHYDWYTATKTIAAVSHHLIHLIRVTNNFSFQIVEDIVLGHERTTRSNTQSSFSGFRAQLLRTYRAFVVAKGGDDRLTDEDIESLTK